METSTPSTPSEPATSSRSPKNPSSVQGSPSASRQRLWRLKFASSSSDPFMEFLRSSFSDQGTEEVTTYDKPHALFISYCSPEYDEVVEELWDSEPPILIVQPPSGSPRRRRVVRVDHTRLIIPSSSPTRSSQSSDVIDDHIRRPDTPALVSKSASDDKASLSARRRKYSKGRKRTLDDEVEEPPKKRLKRKAISLRPKAGTREPHILPPGPSAGLPSATSPLGAADPHQAQDGGKKPWSLTRWKGKRQRNEATSRRGGKKNASAVEKEHKYQPNLNKSRKFVNALTSAFSSKRQTP